MASNPPRKRGRGADPEQTKSQLIDAAIDGLIEDGFRRTTARSIADRAACNQAAIYYHFGGIEPLLTTALKASSVERLARYEESISGVTDLVELVDRLTTLYQEDQTSGHLRLLTELVGGITASPKLRAGIDEATEPWMTFMETTIQAAAASVPFGNMLPAKDIADLVFSLIVGVELRNNIDGGAERADRLFRMANLAAMLAQGQAKKSAT